MKCAKEVVAVWKEKNDARVLEAVEAITEAIYKKAKESSSYPGISVRYLRNSSDEEVIDFCDSIYHEQVSRGLFLTTMKSLCYEVGFNSQCIMITPNPSC